MKKFLYSFVALLLLATTSTAQVSQTFANVTINDTLKTNSDSIIRLRATLIPTANRAFSFGTSTLRFSNIYTTILDVNKDSNLFIGPNAGASVNTVTPNYANTIVGFNAAPLYNASSSAIYGYRAGSNLTTGGFHCLFGTVTGEALTTTVGASFFGYHAGRLCLSAPNVFMGYLSGERGPNTTSSVYVGYESGKYINGTGVTLLGHQAGGLVTTVSAVEDATAVGWRSQYSIQANGSFNTSVGAFSLRDLTTGISNSALGRYAGRDLTTGSNNVFVGKNSCLTCTTSHNSIILGRDIQTTTLSAGYEMNLGGVIFSRYIYSDTARTGFNKDSAEYTVDINGTLGVSSTPTSTNGTDVLLVKSSTGQVKSIAQNVDGDSVSSGNITIGTVRYYSFSGTTATWTLPTLAASDGATYEIKNRGSGDLTINTAAAGNDIYSTSAVNTITVAAGASVKLHNDSTFFVTFP